MKKSEIKNKDGLLLIKPMIPKNKLHISLLEEENLRMGLVFPNSPPQNYKNGHK